MMIMFNRLATSKDTLDQRISNSPRCVLMWQCLRQTARIALLATLLAGLPIVMTGCDETDDDGDWEDEEPKLTAATYEIQHGTPGTLIRNMDELDVIQITPRLGVTLTRNAINGLTLTDEVPPRVIGGWSQIRGSSYVKSRKLRIQDLVQPDGALAVQVDVSLGSLLELKTLRGIGKDEYVPAPMLQDSIGNSYWPSGYFLKNMDGGYLLETSIDRGGQFKNLNDLPRLSRNKPQKLTLVFFVNAGVTLESFSYGGGEPKHTFRLFIEN